VPRDFLMNRTCVLTGATGGIGRALACELVAAGARLVTCGRDRSALAALEAELPKGAAVATVTGDLVNAEVQEQLVRTAVDARASVLVNLFGCNSFGLLAEQTPDALAALVTTNLTAPMQITQRLLPHLLGQREAAVVNVGSVLGEIGHAGYAGYCATKFGIRGFSEALRRELADSAVRVYYVGPRATRTAMNGPRVDQLNAALGNAVDEPEQVARRIVRTIGTTRFRITLGWPEQLFCKLNALLPALVDNALAGKLAVIKRYAGLAG